MFRKNNMTIVGVIIRFDSELEIDTERATEELSHVTAFHKETFGVNNV